jgi:hypothetical protein
MNALSHFQQAPWLKFISVWLALSNTLLSCQVATSLCSPPQKVASTARQQAVVLPGGTLQRQGQQFFPFGVYHVSWKVSAQQLQNHVQEITKAGLNTIHASMLESSSYGLVATEASRTDSVLLTEHHLSWSQAVQPLKTQPGLLGWNLADDVDNGQRSPVQVGQLHQQVKALDPQRLTYISGYSDKLKNFQNCSDIIALQVYPFQQGQVDEFAQVYPKLQALREAIPANRRQSIWANLQAFSWKIAKPGSYLNARAPSAKELRNMTYQALLAGVNGILYYAYYDETAYLPSNKPLWGMVKKLNQEIKTLTPAPVSGGFQSLPIPATSAKVGWWQSQDKGFLVVLSLTSRRSQTVSFPLPTPIQSIKPLFSTPPPPVPAASLTVALKPAEVYVYEVTF